VNGERLFDDVAKEMLRKQLWQAAEFCGVRILTYAILSNHFHVLVAVPDRSKVTVTDAELIRRYRLLYPKPTRFRPAQVCVLEDLLAAGAGGQEAERVRQALLARMHDVSEFMKTLKQRYSVWFNHTHQRFGTLWADRFRSNLIEQTPNPALLAVAAYIDLNAVRAGLVRDPKDYRFCGYAEAVAGTTRAREGLAAVLNPLETPDAARWKQMGPAYREILYGKGATPKEKAGAIPEEDAAQVWRRHGQLSLTQILHCRLRAMTDGAVLGSRAFVLEHLAAYRARTGRRREIEPQPLPAADLFALRGCPGTRKAEG
jgi:hypothetical protein